MGCTESRHAAEQQPQTESFSTPGRLDLRTPDASSVRSSSSTIKGRERAPGKWDLKVSLSRCGTSKVDSVVGFYDEAGTHRGRKIYKKQDAAIYLYWHDGRFGRPGWWFGASIDGFGGIAYNKLNDDEVPTSGWKALPGFFYAPQEVSIEVSLPAVAEDLVNAVEPSSNDCYVCWKGVVRLLNASLNDDVSRGIRSMTDAFDSATSSVNSKFQAINRSEMWVMSHDIYHKVQRIINADILTPRQEPRRIVKPKQEADVANRPKEKKKVAKGTPARRVSFADIDIAGTHLEQSGVEGKADGEKVAPEDATLANGASRNHFTKTASARSEDLLRDASQEKQSLKRPLVPRLHLPGAGAAVAETSLVLPEDRSCAVAATDASDSITVPKVLDLGKQEEGLAREGADADANEVESEPPRSHRKTLLEGARLQAVAAHPWSQKDAVREGGSVAEEASPSSTLELAETDARQVFESSMHAAATDADSEQAAMQAQGVRIACEVAQAVVQKNDDAGPVQRMDAPAVLEGIKCIPEVPDNPQMSGGQELLAPVDEERLKHEPNEPQAAEEEVIVSNKPAQPAQAMHAEEGHVVRDTAEDAGREAAKVAEIVRQQELRREIEEAASRGVVEATEVARCSELDRIASEIEDAVVAEGSLQSVSIEMGSRKSGLEAF